MWWCYRIHRECLAGLLEVLGQVLVPAQEHQEPPALQEPQELPAPQALQGLQALPLQALPPRQQGQVQVSCSKQLPLNSYFGTKKELESCPLLRLLFKEKKLGEWELPYWPSTIVCNCRSRASSSIAFSSLIVDKNSATSQNTQNSAGCPAGLIMSFQFLSKNGRNVLRLSSLQTELKILSVSWALQIHPA